MKKFFEKIKQIGLNGILLMHLGLISCAIASTIFLSPSHMVASGATGLSILLNSLFDNIPYYVFLYGINGILIVISFIFLGKDFTFKTIYGSLMLPTFCMLVTAICNWFSIDIDKVISNCNSVFVVIFASVLMGFGIGINIKNGGSTGGFDILETIFNKYFHLSFSNSVLILDTVLIVSGMAKYQVTETSLFESKLDEGMAALIYILIMGYIMDLITFGGYNKRAVYIRSDKHEEIHEAITKYLARGITYIDAEGGYTRVPTVLILCICYSQEYYILRDIVSRIDPKAFMFVTKATEVRGLGFSLETKDHLERRKNRSKLK